MNPDQVSYNIIQHMQDKQLKIFFSGIAGSGVSAIALFMADKGNIIYGSDRAFDKNSLHPLRRIFQCRGITIVPQDGNGIDGTFDLAVFSTAVESDKPEAVRARSLGIPLKTRPGYLAEITASFNTIAVAGTSGKSTASGLLAFLMKRLGLEPNFLGGGRVKQFRSSINPGNFLTGNSEQLVIEACESDGTIVNYKPLHSIVLNLDLDHHTIDETAKMFEVLMGNTSGKIIVNADDVNLARIVNENAITFSVHSPSRYKAEDIIFKPFGTDFSLNGKRFSLSLPGEYNLYNALSCLAFLSEIGISLDDTAKVLHEFQGIERRFDIHLNDGERLVVDDYAHNPHKISSLMRAVRMLKEKVCYIFQPHGFGPTRLMKREYIRTFVENLRDSDHLILLPIYYAGGSAQRDISSYDLAEGIRAGGKSAEVVERRGDIVEGIHEYGAYIVFGARDDSLSDFAQDIANAVSR
jgi:UDP-N-acetylmuramate--alanine ligase